MPFVIGHKVNLWKTRPVTPTVVTPFNRTGSPFYLYDFRRQQAGSPLEVSTYLSSQIDSNSAFVLPPAKPESLWLTQGFLLLQASHQVYTYYSRQITFILDYKHWQILNPVPPTQEAAMSICSGVPTEYCAPLQVEGRCSTKQALWSPGRPTSQIRGHALILQKSWSSVT